MSAPVTFSSREVHKVLGIRPDTLRQWVVRGHVRKPARDRYVVEDIVRHCQALAAEDEARPRMSDGCA